VKTFFFDNAGRRGILKGTLWSTPSVSWGYSRQQLIWFGFSGRLRGAEQKICGTVESRPFL